MHKPRKRRFFFLPREDPEKIAQTICASARRFQNLGYNIDDVHVLCPMKKGPIGTIRLNEMLQDILNPPGPGKKEIKIGSSIYRLGDKVMQHKNNYSKKVFNGDVGLVEEISISEEGGKIAVRIRNDLVEYSREEALEELSLAYCTTVHKAQGGEFRVIIMPVSTSHYIMLARNLLYTAITRAREKVVLVGTTKAAAIAIQNNKPSERNTGLRSKINLQKERLLANAL